MFYKNEVFIPFYLHRQGLRFWFCGYDQWEYFDSIALFTLENYVIFQWDESAKINNIQIKNSKRFKQTLYLIHKWWNDDLYLYIEFNFYSCMCYLLYFRFCKKTRPWKVFGIYVYWIFCWYLSIKCRNVQLFIL